MIGPPDQGEGYVEFRALMTQSEDGRWTAAVDGDPAVKASGATRERCLAGLRRAVERTLPARARREPLTIVVETYPLLAGVAEAAEVMGWDKRRVVTYIDRGSFPEPVQSLASGRVWRRSDLEAYAAEWRARHRPARRKR
jgi:predicted RNase H-like HicB family nuclease